MELATRTDGQIETPAEDRRASRQRVSRPSRRRIWMRRAGVVLVVPLLWLTWSVGGALMAPGTDTTTARLAEWARFNGMGWVVSGLEQVQYQIDPPQVGGSLAGGIPKISAPGLASGLPPGASGATPRDAPLAPIPPQAQPALPEEGVWQTLTSGFCTRRSGVSLRGMRNSARRLLCFLSLLFYFFCCHKNSVL